MKNDYALALAGGGTRGAFQVGAWKAIKELDLDIVAISGTSIGAVNGAMMIQGDGELLEEIYNGIEIEHIIQTNSPVDTNRNMFNIKNVFALANDFVKERGLSNAPLRMMLENNLDVSRIYDSKIDFGISTFSVDNLSELDLFKEEIEKDDLIDYILASACLPIFKIQKIGDKKFLDGGVTNNIPVKMLAQKGYKRILVIDLEGPALKKSFKNKDVYIKTIHPSQSLGGLLEFDKKKIKLNIKMGYLDTLKSFARLQGNYFYFDVDEYKMLLDEFSLQTIAGLEFAAKEYGICRYQIFTKRDFLKAVSKRHKQAMEEFLLLKQSFSGIKSAINEFGKSKDVPNKCFILCYFTEMVRRDPLYHATKEAAIFTEYTNAGRALLDFENI
jgi:NTE family protein